MAAARELRSLIRRCTSVSRDHLTPELRLRLITPGCELWTARPEQVPFRNDPFWAFYWPGGQALSRYILDSAGSLIRGRRVLDVGSGCGACALSAVISGACAVTANDIDHEAAQAIQINSELNKLKVNINENNLIGTDCDDFDTILIGDMFYDEEFANTLYDWLTNMEHVGKNVLIGDPGRHGLTLRKQDNMKLLAQYQLNDSCCIENRGFTTASVWKLKPK